MNDETATVCVSDDESCECSQTHSTRSFSPLRNRIHTAFGRKEYPEEAYIRELDGKTGASLKLTILNHAGRIWTMVAGGGASVVYADTISDLGYGEELANYGEYSGAPSTEHTFEYAKTLISLMTREKDPRGKIFIIGGGIANFTDVAATFTGLIKAIVSFQDDLKAHNVSGE